MSAFKKSTLNTLSLELRLDVWKNNLLKQKLGVSVVIRFYSHLLESNSSSPFVSWQCSNNPYNVELYDPNNQWTLYYIITPHLVIPTLALKCFSHTFHSCYSKSELEGKQNSDHLSFFARKVRIRVLSDFRRHWHTFHSSDYEVL